MWLDEDAIEMGEFSDVKVESENRRRAMRYRRSPKALQKAIARRRAIAEDRERIAVYKQMEREFDEGPELAVESDRPDRSDLSKGRQLAPGTAGSRFT